MKSIQLLNFFIILLAFENTYSQTIYEQQNNPNVWAGDCQTGNFQTPINLNEGKAIYTKRLTKILLTNKYNRSIGRTRLFNDGKSINANFLDTNFQPSVSFDLRSYNLVQFHFHWGNSEHALNGQLSDGEIHLVHENASNKSQLLVLGALLKKAGEVNNAISTIFRQAFESLQNYPSEIMVDIPESLKQLLGNVDMSRYLNYAGSLTTPNCSEGVTWIVFPEMIGVDTKAIENLRNIKDKEGRDLVFTNRELQTRNIENRKIYKSYRK